MDDNESNNQNNSKDSFLKSKWDSLSPIIKLKIIGGVAAVFLVIILIALLAGAIPSIFLQYSDGVANNGNIEENYSEYWQDFCKENDSNCSKEQIEANEKLKESQEKFFTKLDKLKNKYSLSNEQVHIILTTTFYGYDINDFTEGNNAFQVDETDDIDFEGTNSIKEVDGKTIYERETDTLKELVKQFKVSTAYCQGKHTVNGETVTDEPHVLYGPDNKTFTFTFMEKVFFTIGKDPNKEGFKEAKEECIRAENGSVYLEEGSTSKASNDAFYDYLINTDYFDSKEHLKGEFTDYAKSNNLSSDLKTWPEEDLQKVRERIVDDIKMIVAEYIEEHGLQYVAKSGTAYWWPIGSRETKPGENGILFASDDPEFTHINSPFGIRVHPKTGIKTLHGGIDLHGIANQTNIIASLDGTVTRVVNGCDSFDSNGCGGGYGNHIEIQDIKGNINIYAHMYNNSISVSVGDTVKQGQVLGKVGSSGTSTGQHLHFTIKVNGEYVDPLDYIDPKNPRPSSSINFNNSRFSKEEYVAKLNEYYSGPVCESSKGDGCGKFKTEIINRNGGEIIYESAVARNLNPEIIIARIISEGYSPGTNHNYFGYGCTNTGGLAACTKYATFQDAVDGFHKRISSYDSAESMMSKYSYIGKYWYTGTHWGLGGCAYATHIYPDGVPDRVSEACSHPDGYCSKDNTANCVPTTEDDQKQYATWQVSKMAKTISNVFG